MARVKNPSVKSCGATHPWCRVCRPDVAEAQRRTRAERRDHERLCRNCGTCNECIGLTAPDGMKVCRGCGGIKSIDQFPTRDASGARRNKCKPCYNSKFESARCLECSAAFWKIIGGDQKYCRPCRVLVNRSCALCGSTFTGSVTQKKYCSVECRDMGQSQIRKDARKRIRDEILQAYGGDHPKCTCCNEDRYHFLALDHVDGGGNRQHKELGGGGFYNWVRKNNYPPGLRILCHNCNYGRQLNGGVCPHENQ